MNPNDTVVALSTGPALRIVRRQFAAFRAEWEALHGERLTRCGWDCHLPNGQYARVGNMPSSEGDILLGVFRVELNGRYYEV